jgi:hypothetical protein
MHPGYIQDAQRLIFEFNHRHHVVVDRIGAGEVVVARHHACGFAQEPAHYIHSVASQIKKGAATSKFFITEPGAAAVPIAWIEPMVQRCIMSNPRAHGGDISQKAILNRLFCEKYFRSCSGGKGNHKFDPSLFDGVFYAISLFHRNGQCFFRKNMFACFCCCDQNLRMHTRGTIIHHCLHIIQLKNIIKLIVEGNTPLFGFLFSSYGVFIPYRHKLGVGVLFDLVRISARVYMGER